MTGTKISALAAVTDLADADLLSAVDVSNASMAPTGTNVKITAANVAATVVTKSRATAAEVAAGTVNNKFITPAGLVSLTADRGEAFMSAFDQKSGVTQTWLHIDDSTGCGANITSGGYTANAWPRRVALDLVTRYPSLRVEYYELTPMPTPTTYSAVEVLSTGIVSGVALADTFAATVANIYGRVADVGGVWNDNSGGVTIRYALSGDGTATMSSNGTTWLTGLRAGYMDTTETWTKNMTSGNLSEFSSYISSSYFLQIRIDSNAVINFIKQYAGATTTVATSTLGAAGLATTGTITVPGVRINHKVNGDVDFYVNSVLLHTETLSGAESATFATASRAGFAGTSTGHKIQDISSTVSGVSTGTLKVYNGSVQSKTADWSLANLALVMGGQTPTYLSVGHGHNHAAESPATFEGKLDALIAGVKAVAPNTSVGIVGQNPEFDPAANQVAHNLREADKRRYANLNGYSYHPGFETYMSQANPSSFVRSADGVHPNDAPLPDGFALSADASMATFVSLSVLP